MGSSLWIRYFSKKTENHNQNTDPSAVKTLANQNENRSEIEQKCMGIDTIVDLEEAKL